MFIVFEGGEGSGKTTQALKLAEALKEKEIPFILTKEPGGTPLGDELREILLDRLGPPMSAKTQALLLAANRADHVESIVAPALARGEVVICDRYIASSVAYQGHAEGLPRNEIRELSEWATNGLYPDVTFFLDVTPEWGLQRARRVKETRFEDKPLGFHYKVQEGYIAQIDSSWVVIDGLDLIEKIAAHIREHVFKMYELKQEARQVVRSVYENSVKTIVENMRMLGLDEGEIERLKKKIKCPTCQGPSRVTKGMVCQTCGKDYGAS
jgi:dTMP kinase